MQIGLIGSGNMARAMARGWGEPILCADGGSGRASELVAEVGGEALPSAEVARRADVVVLCHKPAQLDQVAREIGSLAKCVVSVLGATTTGRVQAAYPETPVFVLIPNTPVEVRRGLIAYAVRPPAVAVNDGVADPELEPKILELFGRLGRVVQIPDKLVDAATSISGVGPAYLAVVAEAQIDAAVGHGVPATLAAELVVETIAGSAALLAQRGYDTLAVRRAVTSPAGSTARGLAALERSGVRAAFQAAMDASVTPEPRRS
ncbi:MAG TPA: pyrroline-5-carboxylate reductase dimerization domain-containing protein [Solirubrobacteraceae bacterium]|jgi:pyrroline-5-carboxylate reductase|nr:pyrroline-5-carboxylate reductase dimerization domain-containing protein [Solirubrobacteraceae bacterium]